MASVKKTYTFLKIFVVLLFWVLVFMVLQKAYNDNNSNVDQNNKIKRIRKYTNFWKTFNILNNDEQDINAIGELLTDKSEVPTAQNLSSAIESELPSIPLEYANWYKSIKRPRSKVKCSKFPDNFKLNYYNTYWQRAIIQNLTFQLYNAYYDTREELQTTAVVRVLAMVNETDINVPVYCQLWYNGSTIPNVTLATDFRLIWANEEDVPKAQLYPHLFSCPITDENMTSEIPSAVTLAANECQSVNNSLRIHYNQPSVEGKQGFAICVKSLNIFEDFSARLVEWIELQLLLGARKIYFYELSLHKNVTKVLKYYAQRGFVDIQHTSFATGEPDMRALQYLFAKMQQEKQYLHEQLFYNDCFYRNLYRYEYITLQDISEVLMPMGDYTSWYELMSIATSPMDCPNGYASYCARNIDFVSQKDSPLYASKIPHFMFMLQHVQRATEYSDTESSCLHRTACAYLVYKHTALEFYNVCPSMYFEESVAQVQHYRATTISNDTIDDSSIWRFEEDLLESSLVALRAIGFLKKLEKDIDR